MANKNGKGKNGKGGKNPDRRPLPSEQDFYDRFTANQPWNNTEEWYGGLLDKREDKYAQFYADGRLTKFEKRKLRRWDRRAGAAENAYRDYLNANLPGGVNEDGGGEDGGGEDGPGGSVFDQGAFDEMFALLESYGLGSLSSVLQDLILNGAAPSTIWLQLQQTDAWRQRFAGNEQLKAQGLGVLSPAEYLALEKSYAQIMRNYGLPSGFYDDPTDFAGFIGKSVSASELQQRVQSYADLAAREDAATVAQLESMGLGKGDLLAYMIDPDRAAPLIQQTYKTALIGSAARRAGFVADNGFLGELAAQGVTEQQATQGYGLIAGSVTDAKKLAQIQGSDYNTRDMETEVFQNNGQAANKRKRLASQERATFSGASGVGSLRRNDAGSY